VAEPTVAEVQRLLLRMHSAGVVKRLDVLLHALQAAYRVGVVDGRASCPCCEALLEG
jgi:hypothetical protein